MRSLKNVVFPLHKKNYPSTSPTLKLKVCTLFSPTQPPVGTTHTHTHTHTHGLSRPYDPRACFLCGFPNLTPQLSSPCPTTTRPEFPISCHPPHPFPPPCPPFPNQPANHDDRGSQEAERHVPGGQAHHYAGHLSHNGSAGVECGCVGKEALNS